MVFAVYTAGTSWLQSNNNFSGVNINSFVNNGSLPKEFMNANANPWGGAVSVKQGGESPTELSVILDKVPQDACQNLSAKVSQKIQDAKATCGKDDPTTFTASFELGQ
jgi:hypothetical protein